MMISGSAVAIDGRALAITGAPGSGKSSLALALIDRGARLIGDDAVQLTRVGDHLLASPPPNIEGLIELRGIGLFDLPIAEPSPLSLVLSLGEHDERLPEFAPERQVLGQSIPCLPFYAGTIAPAIRAELALSRFGRALP